MRKARRGPLLFEVLPKPGRDDRVDVILEHSLSHFSESCPNVLRACLEFFIDGHHGHPVGRVAKSLEIGLGLTLTSEAGWVACFHFDTYYFTHIVSHGVPEASVPVLHTSLLDAI